LRFLGESNQTPTAPASSTTVTLPETTVKWKLPYDGLQWLFEGDIARESGGVTC
jgi:hypothetical protein